MQGIIHEIVFGFFYLYIVINITIESDMKTTKIIVNN